MAHPPRRSVGARRRALNAEQIDARIRRWQRSGDEQARDELVDEFMPMARRLAGRYRSPTEQEDLVQVACLGLLGAIDRFDTERGFGFTTFAIPTILGELKRYFRNNAWAVHVPRRAQELAQRVQQANAVIAAQRGASPRVSELAAFLELELDDVIVGLEASRAHYADSLDAPVPGQGDVGSDELTMVDVLGGDDERFDLIDTKLSVSALLPRLPFAERRAVELRYGTELMQREIAEILGCSQMQVSRLLRRAAGRLELAIG